MSKPIRCTTHSNACDCREYYFKQLEKSHKILLDALNSIAFAQEGGENWSSSRQAMEDTLKAREAIENSEAVLKG